MWQQREDGEIPPQLLTMASSTCMTLCGKQAEGEQKDSSGAEAPFSPQTGRNSGTELSFCSPSSQILFASGTLEKKVEDRWSGEGGEKCYSPSTESLFFDIFLMSSLLSILEDESLKKND